MWVTKTGQSKGRGTSGAADVTLGDDLRTIEVAIEGICDPFQSRAKGRLGRTVEESTDLNVAGYCIGVD